MTTPLDTEDWRLAAYLDWKPNKKPIQTTCTRCGGSGQIGGHFKSLDDPQPCPECFGRGYREESGITTPKPEMPQSLVDHMRKALMEYCEQNKHKEG